MRTKVQRRIEIVENNSIPPLDIVFAFGPMLPLVAGAVAAWWLSPSWSAIALSATALWGGAILLFLAGVRRGLSFRTAGGPTLTQMATMLTLYCLGIASLAAVFVNALILAFVLLLVGYAMVFVLDPIAARCGEVPLYFENLRRLQIPLALLSLVACLILSIRMP